MPLWILTISKSEQQINEQETYTERTAEIEYHYSWS